MSTQSVHARLSAKLVVVIDDDPLVLEAMEGLLRKWGYHVLATASDGAALAKLTARRQSPDLIVCDYHLSDGVKGNEAIERLQKVFRVPAFLISGDAAMAESGRASARGLHLLRKPVDAKILRALLKQVLDEDPL
jgi:CheY-like chemotaxis protein